LDAHGRAQPILKLSTVSSTSYPRSCHQPTKRALHGQRGGLEQFGLDSVLFEVRLSSALNATPVALHHES
jgi:hypothetical protein